MMIFIKTIPLVLIVSLGMTDPGFCQTTNYDEDKVPPYELPDPLTMPDGKKVTKQSHWNNIQRPAIYELFEENVYGKFPQKKLSISYKVKSIDEQALNGKAIRKEVSIYFSAKDTTAKMDMLLFLPKGLSNTIPVFLGYNFNGNHTTSSDPGITRSTQWMRPGPGIVGNKATEETRGAQQSRWPITEAIQRGYGIATIYYGDIEPDHAEGWKSGIRTQLQKELDIQPDEWSAIGAWAWGLSRALDYLENEKEVDPKQVILIGHSRLGKAALWAGASDERFAIVISNESGEGGAALSKRIFGETIKDLNKTFPHWFVENYNKYNDDAEALPVDQHMLLAMIAPRPLYVSSAEEDLWADPKGEFLSARNAERVYQLFKKPGLGTEEMPALNHPVGDFIRYHIRRGKHDITNYDWEQYLNFADRHLRK